MLLAAVWRASRVVRSRELLPGQVWVWLHAWAALSPQEADRPEIGLSSVQCAGAGGLLRQRLLSCHDWACACPSACRHVHTRTLRCHPCPRPWPCLPGVDHTCRRRCGRCELPTSWWHAQHPRSAQLCFRPRWCATQPGWPRPGRRCARRKRPEGQGCACTSEGLLTLRSALAHNSEFRTSSQLCSKSARSSHRSHGVWLWRPLQCARHSVVWTLHPQ